MPFLLPLAVFKFLSSPTTRNMLWTATSTKDIGRVRQRTVSKPREINGAYLWDEENPGDLCVFQNMPTEFSDSKSADWSDTVIPGRSEPIKGYAASSARSFSLNITFVESMDQGDTPGFVGPVGPGFPAPAPWYVRDKVNFCRSLVYPDYDAGDLVQPPHTVIFVVGKLIRSRCVCKDVGVTWKGPWDPVSLIPMIAEVQMTLEEVNTLPWGQKDVRAGMDLTPAGAGLSDSNDFTFYD
jgi:hypothetical protein